MQKTTYTYKLINSKEHIQKILKMTNIDKTNIHTVKTGKQTKKTLKH